MSSRRLPPGTHGLDVLQIGDVVETAKAEVTPDMIDRFAALTGDRFGIHMDDEFARAAGFPRRVAHGLLVLSVIDGLKNQTPAQFDAVASLRWEWSFHEPVLAGDSVSAKLEIRAMRHTSDGRRGIIKLGVDVMNQRSETVQSGVNLLMVHR